MGQAMKNTKIGVQVKKVKEPDGKEALKATAPMRLIFEEGFDAKWLNEELKKIEGKYLKLVDNLKSILNLIKSRKGKSRVLLYWMFGDEIYEFIEEDKNGGLFLEGVTKHLIRDIGVSHQFINRCKQFRLLYPDISKIDLNKSFNSYVETFERGYVSAKRRQRREPTEAKDAR